MSLKKLIAGLFGIDDNSEIYYSKGYNKGYEDGYVKAQKEFSEQYEIIGNNDGLTQEEDKMFKKLKSWRYMKAKRLRIEPYMVLHDAELISAIKAKPQNTDELLEIRGFGERNVAKYGKDLIQIINKEN